MVVLLGRGGGRTWTRSRPGCGDGVQRRGSRGARLEVGGEPASGLHPSVTHGAGPTQQWDGEAGRALGLAAGSGRRACGAFGLWAEAQAGERGGGRTKAWPSWARCEGRGDGSGWASALGQSPSWECGGRLAKAQTERRRGGGELGWPTGQGQGGRGGWAELGPGEKEKQADNRKKRRERRFGLDFW